MENEEKNEEKTSGTIKVITDLAKTIPIYQDVAQPAAQEVGKSLQIIAKTVNIALSPIKALVWSYEKLEQFINKEVSTKLENVPESNIQTPKANIAVPALQALMYSEDEPELQDLFANLLACSMDKSTAHEAHPSFVEAIKQMTPDEARIMKFFSLNIPLPVITIYNNKEDGSGGRKHTRHITMFGEKANCQIKEMVPVYLDNLIRLGFIEIPDKGGYLDEIIYKELENADMTLDIIREINAEDGRKHNIVRQSVYITDIGIKFIESCVIDHRERKN